MLIIFAWTPPHFWALALDRKEEYRNANVPMLPVTHGESYTRWHILIYTLILFVVTLMPYLIAMSGLIYLVSAAALGIGFLYWAVELLRANNPRAPIETFRYSILYLMLLFIALLHRSLRADRRSRHWTIGISWKIRRDERSSHDRSAVRRVHRHRARRAGIQNHAGAVAR